MEGHKNKKEIRMSHKTKYEECNLDLNSQIPSKVDNMSSKPQKEKEPFKSLSNSEKEIIKVKKDKNGEEMGFKPSNSLASECNNSSESSKSNFIDLESFKKDCDNTDKEIENQTEQKQEVSQKKRRGRKPKPKLIEETSGENVVKLKRKRRTKKEMEEEKSKNLVKYEYFDNQSYESLEFNLNKKDEENLPFSEIKDQFTPSDAYNYKIFENISCLVQRREKILSFLCKEQYQLTNPDLHPFINENHAYECLLPYHIYSLPLYEDLLFFNSREDPTLLDRTVNLMDEFENILLNFYDEIDFEPDIIVDLLLIEEDRYIFNKLHTFLDKLNEEEEINEREIKYNISRSKRRKGWKSEPEDISFKIKLKLNTEEIQNYKRNEGEEKIYLKVKKDIIDKFLE
ncbi:hypothetical protein CWI37_1369p0020 [Hamiltosporidium tvaerminnensis]|uniref:GLTSCR protein conserved domain-containing protein n=1 Tax=Hamiltosporidium tvaerminnensis TaxID=1176355 RepID=A0A4Q9KY84_9MICR|nr:hypothetical protein LUQ84_000119 [Hamiltosporidium tvaerminnensis]TBT99370.1 hypothetical protein CWI37_1369p0020 [Hamiltosporidium tvaerminnensis]